MAILNLLQVVRGILEASRNMPFRWDALFTALPWYRKHEKTETPHSLC